MAVEFDRTFGAPQAGSQSNSVRSSGSSRTDQPAAKVWANIGYIVPNANEDGSDRFVSLPVGIPVDTTSPLEVKGNSDDYRAFLTARNDLLAQVQAAADKLAPGDEKIIGDPTGLCIQLRRVADAAAPIAADQNKFSRTVAL